VAVSGADIEEALSSIPFDYEVSPNLTYIRRPDWEGRLDLFLPADRTRATPTLVWFHGGGFTQSSKEQELLYFLPYLHRRWSVVNVEYRLVDRASAPGAIADGLCAMRWVAAHAAQHELQLDKLVVSGISAGGTLALVAGTTPGSSPLAADCGPPSDFGQLPVPRVIVNWFGPSDLLDLIAGPHRQSQVARWFAGVPNPIEVATLSSPIKYIRAPVPPVISIHGDADDAVPYEQSVALHRLLDQIGSPNKLVRIRGAGHGDFTPEQASHAYATVFGYVNAAIGPRALPPHKGMKGAKPAPR
jgi:acetyl esterase/lipase